MPPILKIYKGFVSCNCRYLALILWYLIMQFLNKHRVPIELWYPSGEYDISELIVPGGYTIDSRIFVHLRRMNDRRCNIPVTWGLQTFDRLTILWSDNRTIDGRAIINNINVIMCQNSLLWILFYINNFPILSYNYVSLPR